ncbi:GNAT family N-acetyltransferase [Lactococcus piscium]|uniref:GNAT family N-acetyltransferase n=1 Tax=Pseudolactococcus carnosus TaxID=2749961 RepID=UPI001FB97DF4|nr:GNAT family protein [Lactococcus carnosus]MCJ1995355.1 GNAT family N-acetyltransferase [Lactococcus carnosus]
MMLNLRQVQPSDISICYDLKYGKNADLAWMAYNGPYFGDSILSVAAFDKKMRSRVKDSNYKLITVNAQIVGEVSAYWVDGDLKKWLEVGILIYQKVNWGKGISSLALSQWLRELFVAHPDIVHIGLTTWSGNPAMMRVGEKSGMTKEGTIRQVRYWQGSYYDSVKYGVLRHDLQSHL